MDLCFRLLYTAGIFNLPCGQGQTFCMWPNEGGRNKQYFGGSWQRQAASYQQWLCALAWHTFVMPSSTAASSFRRQATRQTAASRRAAAAEAILVAMPLTALLSCGLLHSDSLQPLGLASRLLIFFTKGRSSLYLSKYSLTKDSLLKAPSRIPQSIAYALSKNKIASLRLSPLNLMNASFLALSGKEEKGQQKILCMIGLSLQPKKWKRLNPASIESIDQSPQYSSAYLISNLSGLLSISFCFFCMSVCIWKLEKAKYLSASFMQANPYFFLSRTQPSKLSWESMSIQLLIISLKNFERGFAIIHQNYKPGNKQSSFWLFSSQKIVLLPPKSLSQVYITTQGYFAMRLSTIYNSSKFYTQERLRTKIVLMSIHIPPLS